jgi:hypothetical protein
MLSVIFLVFPAMLYYVFSIEMESQNKIDWVLGKCTKTDIYSVNSNTVRQHLSCPKGFSLDGYKQEQKNEN